MHFRKFTPSQWSSFLVQSPIGNMEFTIPVVSLRSSPGSEHRKSLREGFFQRICSAKSYDAKALRNALWEGSFLVNLQAYNMHL